VWIEFSKNQSKKQKPADAKNQSEKQGQIDGTQHSKKQKPTDVKKSPFGVFDWLMVSIIVSLIIIGYSIYYKGLDFYSVFALSIEWIIMSLFLTFFWGSIYGAIVKKYGKKNWKNVYLGTACIMSIVSACVIYAKPIAKNDYIPEVQKNFWGITLDASKSDIKSMKGNPSEVEKDYKWKYTIESQDSNHYSGYLIVFKDDRVRVVVYRGSNRSAAPELQGIKLFDTAAKVRSNFGEPSQVTTSTNKTNRVFIFDKYHVFFLFKKNKVIQYGIYNPKLGKLPFKLK
jgi:hypothetical protein